MEQQAKAILKKISEKISSYTDKKITKVTFSEEYNEWRSYICQTKPYWIDITWRVKNPDDSGQTELHLGYYSKQVTANLTSSIEQASNFFNNIVDRFIKTNNGIRLVWNLNLNDANIINKVTDTVDTILENFLGLAFLALFSNDTIETSKKDQEAVDKPEQIGEDQKMHPDFINIPLNASNLVACAIASLSRHMIVADKKVDEGEIPWIQEIIQYFDAVDIPVGDVWDEVDDAMQIFESAGVQGSVLTRSANLLKEALNDEQKNFLLTAFQNIIASDDYVSYQEFMGLRFTLELWYPGATEQLIENFRKSGIELGFDIS